MDCFKSAASGDDDLYIHRHSNDSQVYKLTT